MQGDSRPIKSMMNTYPQMRVLENLYNSVEDKRYNVVKRCLIEIPLALLLLLVSILVGKWICFIQSIVIFLIQISIFYFIISYTSLREEYQYIKLSDNITRGISLAVVDELTKKLIRKEYLIELYKDKFFIIWILYGSNIFLYLIRLLICNFS